ncbi:hypothetical protein [Gemmobacter aquaticus]|uniref:hypothetical protein n=1 Tax=Gemmobacter aquaticus TaxID=490185 RepID=UPI0011B79DB5|nr:hypothetical protein [Gemmobacter aquaticus]
MSAELSFGKGYSYLFCAGAGAGAGPARLRRAGAHEENLKIRKIGKRGVGPATAVLGKTEKMGSMGKRHLASSTRKERSRELPIAFEKERKRRKGIAS